jgi:hypothetical protein
MARPDSDFVPDGDPKRDAVTARPGCNFRCSAHLQSSQPLATADGVWLNREFVRNAFAARSVNSSAPGAGKKRGTGFESTLSQHS